MKPGKVFTFLFGMNNLGASLADVPFFSLKALELRGCLAVAAPKSPALVCK